MPQPSSEFVALLSNALILACAPIVLAGLVWVAVRKELVEGLIVRGVPWHAILTDNPILTRHARSKLRRSRVATWSVIVTTICFAICWGFYLRNGLIGTTPLTLVVMLQVIILVFGGAAEIGASIGGARESGILDFHRVSPIPPLWVAVGFFLGAPLLQYWLTLLTVPFALYLAAVGPAGWQELVAFELPLLLGAWLIHAVSMLGAMVSKKPKGTNRAMIAVVFLGVFMGQGLFFGVRSALFDLGGRAARFEFFGVPIPWIPFLVVYEAILLGFLLIPSVRRMRSDRLHLYTKPQALAFLATLMILILGPAWSFRGGTGVVLVVLYSLSSAAVALAAAITPDRQEYITGLMRAARSGRRRPSPWSDGGITRIPLFAMCALVLIGSTIAAEVIEGQSASVPIAIGVLTVAYTGLGLQAAKLASPKHGQTVMALFVFFAWVVPPVVGAILAYSQVGEQAMLTTLAVSPLAGIVITFGLPTAVDLTPARVAALGPALTFAFVAHFLLDVVQRRIDVAVLRSQGRREPDPFDDIFGAPGREKAARAEVS